MSNKNKTGAKVLSAIILFVLFAAFTLLLRVVDVQAVGPMGSSVGFASVNDLVFTTLGESGTWYTITKLVGAGSIAFGALMGVWMLVQMIRKGGIFRANHRFYPLMALYVVLGAAYIAFDKVIVINFRPVLEDGALAPSYPSSHTLLTVTIMCSAASAIPGILHKRALRPVCWAVAIAVSAVMVVGRLLAGVHWLTDVLGSVLLSAALVSAYDAVSYAIGRRIHMRRRAAKRRR